ncbi:MAG TPA: hypothetical protein VJB97_04990 [Candidatus Paceibacterota bacterium]
MGEMQFESDQENEFGAPPVRNQTDLTGKLIAWGLASNRQQAQYLMIGAFFVILIVAIWIYATSGSEAPAPLPPLP